MTLRPNLHPAPLEGSPARLCSPRLRFHGEEVAGGGSTNSPQRAARKGPPEQPGPVPGPAQSSPAALGNPCCSGAEPQPHWGRLGVCQLDSSAQPGQGQLQGQAVLDRGQHSCLPNSTSTLLPQKKPGSPQK